MISQRAAMGSTAATVLLQQAHAHHRAGRLAEADTLYARVRSLMPRSFDAYHLSGFLALQQRRYSDASSLLKRACELNARSASAWLRWARALKALGQTPDACEAAKRAAELDPKNADAHFMLGELAAATGGFARAVPPFRRVVELQPEAADGWANLGVALTQSGGSAEACLCFDRALAIDAANGQALTGRALALQQNHRVVEAAAAFAAAIEKQPGNFQARSGRLLTLQYGEEVSREALFAEHVAFGQAARAHAAASPFVDLRTKVLDARSRLRVGFLSPDFRSHSVSYFIQPLLAHLDPMQFEVFLYHDHPVVDATSEQLRARAAQWRHCAGWPDARVEAMIHEDAPDVLVDLAGHTGFNRLPLFARRLAPVQISYLGYPDTTGLAEVDFRLTDAIADPEGDADKFHTERLVRFAPTAWAYAPPPDAPEPSRASGEAFTFGCFNNFSKVSDTTLRLWSGVLAAVPGSRLLLKSQGLDDPAIQPWSRARLIAHGIDPERVDLLGRISGRVSHLSAYSSVDVALDTFPYHGTTTTCEALWMGVPVVTLAGDTHRSRVGVSLLKAAGHMEWVAHSECEYVNAAATLAANGARTTAAGVRLRETVGASTLLDHNEQAQNFGAALRWCWHQRSESVSHRRVGF